MIADRSARLTMAQGAALAAVEPAAVPRTMRALVKDTRSARARSSARCRSPSPGPGEVLVQVLAASVCGTDVHIERWDAWAQEQLRSAADDLRPRDGRHRGRAAARARRASPLGELVAAETHLVDWTCYQCRTGRAHVCQHLRILGVHAPGSFAAVRRHPGDQCLGQRGPDAGGRRAPGADGQRRPRRLRGGDRRPDASSSPAAGRSA